MLSERVRSAIPGLLALLIGVLLGFNLLASAAAQSIPGFPSYQTRGRIAFKPVAGTGPYEVGVALELLQDTNAWLTQHRGTNFVPVVIYYPLAPNGTPLKPFGTAKTPAVVFLHGTRLGPYEFYRDIGGEIASRGFVVIMPDRSLDHRQPTRLMIDAASINLLLKNSPAMQSAGQPSMLEGYVDPDRLCLTGHSLGAGAQFPLGSDLDPLGVHVEYRCHFAWGPWVGPYKVTWKGESIARPFGLIVGREDTYSGVPPNNFKADAYSYFNDAKDYREFKLVYEMKLPGGIVEHMTPVIDAGGIHTGIFHRSQDVFESFCRVFLLDQENELDNIVGPTALANPYTSKVSANWRRNFIGTRKSGAELITFGEPGPINFFADGTNRQSPIPTSFGNLWLHFPVVVGSGTIPAGSHYSTLSLPAGLTRPVFFQSLVPVDSGPVFFEISGLHIY